MFLRDYTPKHLWVIHLCKRRTRCACCVSARILQRLAQLPRSIRGQQVFTPPTSFVCLVVLIDKQWLGVIMHLRTEVLYTCAGV